ncbi:MAG: ParB N-terminal domain-containing protein [Kiloniellales bacterium]|nr:ParB N-terminal domain-containing protein [Kiloniellales bacterium]
MLKEVPVPIAEIYVPARLRGTLDAAKVETLAEDILEHGQQTAISVRKGDNRYVLVSGLHRLEACKALGEATIKAIIVRARQF